MMKYILILSMLCTALNIHLLGTSDSKVDTLHIESQTVEDRVKAIMNKHNIPAVSFAIINEGKLVELKGVGLMNRSKKDPVNPQSLYQIGSLSKMITGIIANELIHEGVLDRNAHLLDYLPITITTKAKKNLKDIQVHHILHHASGLKRSSKVVKRIDGDPMIGGYSEADLIEDLHKAKLKSKPGSTYSYSNLGFAFVGYLCERASGLSYPELLEKYIIQPYGLNHTTLLPVGDKNALVVQPYRKDKPNVKTRPWEMGKLAPAGGIYSNAEDLSKLMLAQINAYQKYSKNPIANGLITTADHFEKETGLYYGYGINEDTRSGNTWLSHGGDLDGYASAYIFCPKLGKGMLFLTSCGGKWGHQLTNELMHVLKD